MNARFTFASLATTALLLALTAPEARAQTSGTDVAPTTLTAGPDSAQVSTPAVPDSVRRTGRLFGLRMTKPTKAGVLAALLPGAGQLYNGRWWKVPIVLAGVGGTVYGEIRYQTLYKGFANTFNDRTDGDPTTNREVSGPNGTVGRPDEFVRRGVNVYRRQRDSFVAWIALAYSIQILDAVVDAHLRDFDISDDLSVQWEPTLLRMPTVAVAPGVGLTFTLK